MREQREILDRLTQIFRDVFDDDGIQLTQRTTADDIGGWDSFNHINLMVATEAAFNLKFRTAEIEDFKNVGALVEIIQRKAV